MATKRILILGGTGFIGPAQIRYALARGHEVSVFNRARLPLPDDIAGVEQLTGDRATGDLRSLAGRTWDVCIDNPTTLPRWARDATQALAGSVGQYIFVSTISVYADPSQRLNEDSPLAKYTGADAHAETMDSVRASGFELYGPLKALSEGEVRQRFPSGATIVRPGLIVGPGDNTDRFTYWPWRVRRGGDMLAPGKPEDPTQIIDARDLSEWIVRLAENGTTGVFNATGPAQPLTFGAMLPALRDMLKSDATLTWVPADFLEQHKVAPWSDLPAWMPGSSGAAGLMRADISRAIAAGLTFRPFEETVRDTLAWFDALPAERCAATRAGLAADREQEVLKAWASR